MKLFENCLIACDIDGTLMTNGVIPRKNKEKITFFVENGGDFALSTGRSLCAVCDVLEQIDDVYYGVFANGAVIYDRLNDRFISERTLDRDDAAIAAEINRRFPGIGIEAHFQKSVGVFRETEETLLHAKYESMSPVALGEDDMLSLGINKILYAPASREEALRLREFVGGYPSNSVFLDTSVTYYGKQRFFIEQVPKGISKAISVKALARSLGTKPGCIYAIGDYYNDVEMLDAADISAAPAGAPEDIKARVDRITDTVENGAVADFIDYLTTIRRK